MPGRLQDSTVIISGAAGGQGRAGALLFAQEGANLALCDVDEDGLARTVRDVAEHVGPDVAVFHDTVDVRSVAQIERFVDATVARFGVIDAIYNNAGVNHVGSIEEATETDFDVVHDINLKAAFFLVKAAIPAMQRSSNASIIHVSSGAGLLAPSLHNSLYCSSKGGLISLTRAQAVELAPFGIRVNCLLPGPIETPMIQKFIASMGSEGERMRDTVVSRSPFKRLGKPEEVAAVAVFLASAEASYISASMIPVDAGWIAV